MPYATNDIVVAATLRVKGYKLNEIMLNNKRGTFVFEDSAATESTQIMMGQCVIEPNAFHTQVRNLSFLVKSMANKTE